MPSSSSASSATRPSSSSPSPQQQQPTAAVASLRATILSAYDLPNRNPPSYVRLTVGTQSVQTGPPTQRHKDRNSFRFQKATTTHGGGGGTTHTNASSPQQQQQQHFALRIASANLESLYTSTATITMVYNDAPMQNLSATLQLSKLHVHETSWLILNLESEKNKKQEEEEEEEKERGEATTTATTTTTNNNNNHADKKANKDNDDNNVDDWENGATTIPTVRLQVLLEGPYRTEVGVAIQACQWWFGAVDATHDELVKVFSPAMNAVAGILPSSASLQSLAAPTVVVISAASPIAVALSLAFLPVVLPVVVVVATLTGLSVAVGAFLWASSRSGRAHVGSTMSPAATALLSTPTGQRLAYQTGPRPSPVAMCRTISPTGFWTKLAWSLFLDAVGNASYLVPVAGEIVDVVFWAHVQTVLVAAMYDTKAPALKYVSFVEEILPFTDVIPSCTMGWLHEFVVTPALDQALNSSASSSNPDASAARLALMASSTEGSNGADALTPLVSNSVRRAQLKSE